MAVAVITVAIELMSTVGTLIRCDTLAAIEQHIYYQRGVSLFRKRSDVRARFVTYEDGLRSRGHELSERSTARVRRKIARKSFLLFVRIVFNGRSRISPFRSLNSYVVPNVSSAKIPPTPDGVIRALIRPSSGNVSAAPRHFVRATTYFWPCSGWARLVSSKCTPRTTCPA